MRISVIIPCYNQGQYLAQAIESVLGQTIKPYEVIVVNDGSQDETRYIAKSYSVKYIEQKNKGLASARNTGIMNMTGDWFMPLDADDMMLENCLETIAKQETDADIIAPSFRCFGVNTGDVILMDNPTLRDFKPVDFKSPMNRIGYFSAIKKEALLEIGGYSPKMTWGWEDYALWIDLLSRGKKILTLKDILILYRTKTESMITEANKHSSELMSQIYKDFSNL